MLQDKGFKVAFVTDGRMSGASGKTPAAIHVSPEALAGGPLAHVRDGDIIRLDAEAGVLTTVGAGDLSARPAAHRSQAHADASAWGYGRELFGAFRHVVTTAEQGATVCFAVNGSSSVVHADTPPESIHMLPRGELASPRITFLVMREDIAAARLRDPAARTAALIEFRRKAKVFLPLPSVRTRRV